MISRGKQCLRFWCGVVLMVNRREGRVDVLFANAGVMAS